MIKAPCDIELIIDRQPYRVEVTRNVVQSPAAPKLIIVSHIINDVGKSLLKACLDGVKHFTPETHEVWVVDNNSPRENLVWLLERDDVNVALNRVEPIPPDVDIAPVTNNGKQDQKNWGSYANAIGLEIGIRLVDPLSKHVMLMHMDTCPSYPGWLSFLTSKIVGPVRAAGVRLDKSRTPDGVLHVLGYVVDYQLFRKLGLDFFPNLPELDVGDKVTVKLREFGYDVFSCKNTMWSPELDGEIPLSSPLKGLRVDRAFDDNGNVIFLHLGRGVRRSTGEHKAGISLEEWLDVIYNSLFLSSTNPAQDLGIFPK